MIRPRPGPRLRKWSVAAVAVVAALPACDRPDTGEGDAVVDSVWPSAADTAPVPGADAPEGDTVGIGADPVAPAGDDRLTGFDTVFVYFTNAEEDQVPVARPVADTAHGLRAAFTALLAGPTADERATGLHSWFSDETAGMLRSVTVTDGFAVVDFEDLRPVIPNAVGSAGALMLLGELTATAFQFPSVRRVEFRIDGSCEALMAWLQFGCHPIRRGEWDPPPRVREAVRK